MKILLVIDSLGSGGAQRLYAHLAKSLSKSGHQVEIFIYVPDNNFYEEDFVSAGIKIHLAAKQKPGFSWNVVAELRQLLKEGYDGVISTMHVPSIYSALAKLNIKKGRLIVCEVSSSAAPVPKFRRFLFYLSSLLADSVVANSYSEAELMKRHPGLSKKITTIWNGYDVKLNKFEPCLDATVPKKFLVVGRIAYPKNGLNLLKALALFYSRNSWLPKVVWAGRKDIDKRSIDMQIEMDNYLVDHPEVSSCFEMLGEVKNVEQLYKESDALLHISLYEGLPNVICEAMMLGCPVIASDVCDHPVVLGEGRGLLCDPQSPLSICESIECFSKFTSEQRAAITVKSREFAESYFEIDRMAEGFEKLLSSE